MQSTWPVVFTLAAALVSGTTGFTSPLLMPTILGADAKTCPAPMEGFELSQFLGDWYLLEYEFAAENKLNRLDCLGFKFTLNDIDSTNDVMISNFTFRFPPATGFMYHVPTFAIFDDETNARWNTNFKNVEMVSAVVDTDYSRWAVVAQCTKNAAGEATFQSSRILSRSRSLRSPDLDRARAAIRDADVEGPYKYTIDQENCH